MPNDFETESQTIQDILARAEKQRAKSRKVLDGLEHPGEGHGRKPVGEFIPSSFLFIRSTQTDNGVRQLAPGTVFWLSPDIRIRPLTGTGSYTQTLEAGRTYDVEVQLRNRGDLAVPSAKVELFMSDPTIGFDTRFATKIGLGSTWVHGLGSGKVNITYTVPSNEAGHKCMIARVFSLSPIELPLDDTNLNPVLDRHVAQLNLNILPSGAPLQFNIIHQPNFAGTVQFQPVALKTLMATGHPALAELNYVERKSLPASLLRETRFKLVGGESQEVSLKHNGRQMQFESRGDGPSLSDQKELAAQRKEAIAAIASGGANASKFKEVFSKHRKFGSAVTRSVFVMDTPKIGLSKGEATAINLQLTSGLGEITGGITILLLG